MGVNFSIGGHNNATAGEPIRHFRHDLSKHSSGKSTLPFWTIQAKTPDMIPKRARGGVRQAPGTSGTCRDSSTNTEAARRTGSGVMRSSDRYHGIAQGAL